MKDAFYEKKKKEKKKGGWTGGGGGGGVLGFLQEGRTFLSHHNLCRFLLNINCLMDAS